MPFTYFNMTGFRNLVSVEWAPLARGFNFILGPNGSGKTSLLEAIYYLSLARSFRTSLSTRVIHHDCDKFSLFAHLQDETGQILPLGLERNANSQLKLRLQGRDVPSIVEIARLVPVQLIDSHCHELLEGAPAGRRHYLDWGIFYLNPDFLRCWKQFVRALKQRNAILRHLGPMDNTALAAWTHELCEIAGQIDQFRHQYIAWLQPVLEELLAGLLSLRGLKISYASGCGATSDYSKNLQQNLAKDRHLGHTQLGPQKADLKITINNIPAKDILSRGQQKLFVCAMILARGALLQSRANKQPIYLVDDLPSELDANNRSSLIALLSKQETQVFITAVDGWEDTSLITGPMKMFHVEHGQVNEHSMMGVAE